MKMIDYEIIDDLLALYEHKVVVYGTGVYGGKVARALSDMKIEVSFFVETNPSEKFFQNTEIVSWENFLKKQEREAFLVIVASEKYYEEMIQKLHMCNNVYVCSYYALFISLYLNYEKCDLDNKFKDKIRLYLEASKDFRINLVLDANWGLAAYVNILEDSKKVWVYQPGKVGSKTICNSSSMELLHIHSLAGVYGLCKEKKAIYDKMLSMIKEKPIKIITGVREPISRDISAFFQNSDKGIYPLFIRDNVLLNLYGDYYNDVQQELTYSVAEKRLYTWKNSLQASFDEMCEVILRDRTDEFSWFDYEIKALFGIDIFDYPFDKERGFSIIKHENIQIFVYKCEKLNELENEIGTFIGDDGFKISNKNVGKNKVYSHVYQEFKDRVAIKEAYFDYYYENPKWLNHFYTESEIVEFRNKWKEKICK